MPRVIVCTVAEVVCVGVPLDWWRFSAFIYSIETMYCGNACVSYIGKCVQFILCVQEIRNI